MKTVDATTASDDLVKLLNEARDEDVVIRLSDGSEFLLVSVDEFDYEVAKLKRNDALTSFLQRRASQPPTSSIDEVKRRLQL